ncbi:MAG: hypothetical protein EON61_28215 [Alphaproteobacteria bacterium]|nr:MAG: hypothetical protein EON61_28215 [Alphaproteobacteria bacterium]
MTPRAHAQVFNSQPYTAAPDPAVEQLRQRVEQLENDLRKATDRAEVLGAQLSDARRVADEANARGKKLETDNATLLHRIENLEDASGGAVSASGGSASLPLPSQSAGLGANASPAPAPAAPAVDLAALPQDEEGFFNSAHAMLLGGDFPGSQQAFTSYLAKFPKGAKAADAQYYLGESLLWHGQAGACDARHGQECRQLQDARHDVQAVSESVGRRQADGCPGTPVREVFVTLSGFLTHRG